MRASGCLAEADNVGEVNLKGFTKLLCFSHFSLPFGKLERVQRNCSESSLSGLSDPNFCAFSAIGIVVTADQRCQER